MQNKKISYSYAHKYVQNTLKIKILWLQWKKFKNTY